MSFHHHPSSNGKTSIKHWWIPLDVQSFQPDATILNKKLHASSTSCTKGHLPYEKQASQRFTISHFRSAVSGIWDCVGQPASFHTKDNPNYDNNNIYHKDSVPCLRDNGNYGPSKSVNSKKSWKDPKNGRQISSIVQKEFQDLKRIKKALLFASCNRNINNLFILSDPLSNGDSGRTDEMESLETFTTMEVPPGSSSTKPTYVVNDLVKPAESACKHKNQRLSGTLSIENIVTDQHGGSSDKKPGNSINYDEHPSSLCSTHSLQLQPSTHIKEPITIAGRPASGLQFGCSTELSASITDSTSVLAETLVQKSFTNDQNAGAEELFSKPTIIGQLSQKPWLAMQNNLHHAFSNNRHALAGALAGTLVTLCLHPVDTVKTIIQANRIGQKSFYHVLRRTISEKGIFGLYRGIASNIASSAPVSAIYTFTYESVKGSLLPLLPQEYHSFAHCIAGGCSSIATSFIFTPSERIKQQMQVGSQYQNCWNAFIGCLQNGGIPSLYAGWGAVLCRNIPHSIIKFYTYESLKQLFSSTNPDASSSTLQTLVCGGLAGSTAALFTTPFDVVKTRLQTQAPGSIGKYHGVFHALKEIARQEGLQGLYRGLTPRLAMYMSQGAIFFASYEFLKAVFLLENPKVSVKLVEDEQSPDDLATGRMQKLPAQ
ncbi:Protein mitoferrin-like 1, chloroplastic [Apostasia shenzhenica]|uniref:Protein mitoferrin-like 1, chloroplastic n=1 Tax=Apostasia shenzhenica TaxID=1088818 RepID=A0A2H9ZRL8_9ASPA|nr:Protein mitoferrin-like 1, chloroplastic [Apostasia shenzhenica]